MRTQSFTDFSGGVTDKTIPGSHNRYLAADNLLIDADQKLFTRNGFAILSSTAYQLTAANERVARLINFGNDTEIVAVQTKNAQYVSAGAWTNLLGPTSNKAFNTNTSASLIEESQWAAHLFLASDSGDPVIKLFKDGSTWKLRTAGLPKPAVTASYSTDAAKLSAAITLAVDIKTQLKAHVDDYGATPAAHIAQDTAVSTALGALSTPVTLSDLITYTTTLRTQYNAHVTDSRLTGVAQVYHIQISGLTATATEKIRDPILNQLAALDTPADAQVNTIEEVVRILNDLRNKYNWHAVAPITHNNATQSSASWGAHFVTAAILNLDAVTPNLVANITTLTRYVNYLKAEYNDHAVRTSGSFYHKSSDSSNIVKMADATDHHTAVGLLACINFHYATHIEHANSKDSVNSPIGFYGPTEQLFYTFQGHFTSGSPTITGMTPDPTNAVTGLDVPIGSYILKQSADVTSPYNNWFQPYFPAGTTIIAKTATTLTMSANATATAASQTFSFHWNNKHADVERNSTAATTTALSAVNFLSLWDPTLQTLDQTILMAQNMAAQLKAHETSGISSLNNSDLINSGEPIGYVKPEYTYYQANLGTSTTEFLSPHFNSWVSGASPPYWPVTTDMQDELNGGQGYFEAGMLSKSYIYRFVYSYDYTVGTTLFTDISAPSDVLEVLSVESPASLTSGDTTWEDNLGITSVPVLANTSNQNYDTANIKVEIYRTIGDGSVYYKVDEVTNGTTSYTDFTDDTTLLNNEALYTNGGIVGNDAPPMAKYITSLENRLYYALENKVYQSLASDPDSVPENFYDTFEETVTGISSTRSNVVVFSGLNVYRLEGQFDELGQGFLRHERIFDRTGCIASSSIVKADNNIFFAGIDGFYCTDGYQVFRVTDFEDTFSSVYTASTGKKNAIQGTYDNIHKKVYWTIKTSDAYTAADKIIVLDLQFGIKKDITPTTTFSGGFDGYAGFRPTAVMFYQNKLHYGDDLGYVYAQNASLYLDLRRDASVAATTWEKRTILWDYKSCHEDYGSPNFRKYFTRVNVEFEQNTNLSVQIKSDADKGRIISSLPIIRSRKLLDWGDSKIDWTSSVYTAKDGGVIDEFRRFKADGSLRSNYRALEIMNAYCVVVASNIMGNLNVSVSATNVWALTLIGAPTYKWPLYSVGYYVRIGQTDYPVTVRVSDSVVLVSDLGLTPSLSAQTNLSWEMWGYPKNEQGKLLNFDVNFEILGQMQKDYQGTTSTDGGQND